MSNTVTIANYFNKHLVKIFLLVAFTTIALAVENYRDYHAYKIGDWLINYQAGFIRRGFFGEFVFTLYEISNIDIGLILIFFQIIVYMLIFILLYKLLRLNKNYFDYSLILISPFFLFFHITDYQAGFRKEILYFLLLAYLIYLSHVNKRDFEKLFYLSILIYPLLILTHEMLALFMPYLLIAYFTINKINYNNFIKITVMLLPSVIAFFYAVTYEPDSIQINKMISVINTVYPIEPSGILWLEKDLYQAYEYTSDTIRRDFYIFYIILLAIMSVALIPLKNKLKIIFQENINIFLLVTMVAGTIVLSLVAIDWGRFIYIHVMSLVLLTLINRENIKNSECGFYKRYLNNISLFKCNLIYFSYAFLWYFPHIHPLKGITRPFRLIEGIIAPYLKLF